MRPSLVALLAGANFAVGLGYGAILPLLPTLLERVSCDGFRAADGLNTGGLTSIYMFAVFLGAPLWGRLADRIGARAPLVFGLVGYAAALVALAAARDLWTAYLLRAVAGVFAGMVLPVVSMRVAGVPDMKWRGKLFVATGAAALLGLLLGPALSGAIALLVRGMVGAMSVQILAWSLGAVGVMAVFVACAAAYLRDIDGPLWVKARGTRIPFRELPRALLAANFLVLFGLGAFEVLLPLVGETRLRLDAAGLAMLFAECSLVMIAVQAILFFTPMLARLPGWVFVANGFAAMAGGSAWFALADTRVAAYASVALVAAGSGGLLPAFGFIATVEEERSAGALFGALTAAASLGQATGSALGGWLFERVAEGSFWVIASVLAAGIGLARQASASRGKLPHPQVFGHGA